MSVWAGWQDQLLKTAGLPDNANTTFFLSEWHSHANTDCTRNPVDISHVTPTSHNCAALPSSKHAQNYASHAASAQAFAEQLNLTDYPQLREAIASGNPMQIAVSRQAGVLLNLQKWGSTTFHAWLQNQWGTGSGFGSGGGNASHVHKGYHDLNKHVTSALVACSNASAELAYATRRLHRRHTVRG